MTNPVPSPRAAAAEPASRTGPPSRASGDERPDHHHHPAVTALATAAIAYVILAVATIGAGLLVTHVLHWHWDVIGVNDWLARHRTGARDQLSRVGSDMAGTMTVIGIGAVVIVVLLIRRWWQGGLFVVLALTLEVTVFLTTTLAVDRARPDVLRLDASPPTSSFPSGHTAAATALYVGLALLLATRLRSALARTVVVLVGLLFPLFVAASRLYRGMHHPTDVVCGALLGAGCLVAAARAVRAAEHAADARDHGTRRPELRSRDHDTALGDRDAEPSGTEPIRTEPSRTEPSRTEPAAHGAPAREQSSLPAPVANAPAARRTVSQ